MSASVVSLGTKNVNKIVQFCYYCIFSLYCCPPCICLLLHSCNFSRTFKSAPTISVVGLGLCNFGWGNYDGGEATVGGPAFKILALILIIFLHHTVVERTHSSTPRVTEVCCASSGSCFPSCPPAHFLVSGQGRCRRSSTDGDLGCQVAFLISRLPLPFPLPSSPASLPSLTESSLPTSAE